MRLLGVALVVVAVAIVTWLIEEATMRRKQAGPREGPFSSPRSESRATPRPPASNHEDETLQRCRAAAAKELEDK